MISSRTPEGWYGRCEVCGYESRMEPSHPENDAPCPKCGTLGWFKPPEEFRIPGDDLEFAVAEWEAAGFPKRVVVDFEGVKVINSETLGRLIRLHARICGVTGAGSRLRVEGMNEEIRKVFGEVGFGRLFDVDDGE